MNFLRRSLWISSKPILIFALLASLASFAFSQTRGGAVAKPQNLGAEDPSKLITLTIWLNQHNKAALDELVRQMYRPGSSQLPSLSHA